MDVSLEILASQILLLLIVFAIFFAVGNMVRKVFGMTILQTTSQVVIIVVCICVGNLIYDFCKIGAIWLVSFLAWEANSSENDALKPVLNFFAASRFLISGSAEYTARFLDWFYE